MNKTAAGKVMNIVRIVISGLLGLFLICQIALGIIVSSSPETAARLPFTVMQVTSDSMYPAIKTGDGVIEVNAPFESLKVGNIITFYQGGELVTHRIVNVENGTVITRGEANTYSDAPVTRSAYAGKVILVLPYFSGFLSLTEGWRKAIWIAVIIFVLFAPEVIFRVSETARRKRRAAN